MDELMLFGALSAQRTEAALLRGNAVTERFGLTLTPEQCGRLLERRASALRETERIEGACGERLGDDELLAALVRLYNGWAGGCADRIADLDGRAMLRFARTGRVGDDDE